MKLYHLTFEYRAKSILSQGFEDILYDGATYVFEGVWLYDAPHAGGDGDTWLSVEIPTAVAEKFRRPVRKGYSGRYREFVIPAEIVNYYGTPTIEENA